MTELTKKQVDIMRVLLRGECFTPTCIGMECGKQRWNASSWACQGLLALTKKGMVEPFGTYGGGHAGYKLTPDGRATINDIINAA